MWHAHFVASFNTRTSPVSGRATECANVTMLVPAVEYVQSAWFKERFLVLNLAQDMFDKVGDTMAWDTLSFVDVRFVACNKNPNNNNNMIRGALFVMQRRWYSCCRY